MRDIVPIIRREIEERGGSSTMGFCNEQILAQLMREGYASIDNESSSSSLAARRTKLTIARYKKSHSGSSCVLRDQDQLPGLTSDELDYIMRLEAQRSSTTHNISSVQLATSQRGRVNSSGDYASSTGPENHLSRAGMTCQEAAYSREAYQIAVNNGSVVSI